MQFIHQPSLHLKALDLHAETLFKSQTISIGYNQPGFRLSRIQKWSIVKPWRSIRWWWATLFPGSSTATDNKSNSTSLSYHWVQLSLCKQSYSVCWLPSCSHRQRIRVLSCKTITIDIVVNGDATMTLQEEIIHWNLNFANGKFT